VLTAGVNDAKPIPAPFKVMLAEPDTATFLLIIPLTPGISTLCNDVVLPTLDPDVIDAR
jgi:hypothetical protein